MQKLLYLFAIQNIAAQAGFSALTPKNIPKNTNQIVERKSPLAAGFAQGLPYIEP
jgi:hypothetical protein